MMAKREHLTEKGLAKIQRIKEGMNKSRKN